MLRAIRCFDWGIVLYARGIRRLLVTGWLRIQPTDGVRINEVLGVIFDTMPQLEVVNGENGIVHLGSRYLYRIEFAVGNHRPEKSAMQNHQVIIHRILEW